jgi:hypothetical protein
LLFVRFVTTPVTGPAKAEPQAIMKAAQNSKHFFNPNLIAIIRSL